MTFIFCVKNVVIFTNGLRCG